MKAGALPSGPPSVGDAPHIFVVVTTELLCQLLWVVVIIRDTLMTEFMWPRNWQWRQILQSPILGCHLRHPLLRGCFPQMWPCLRTAGSLAVHCLSPSRSISGVGTGPKSERKKRHQRPWTELVLNLPMILFFDLFVKLFQQQCSQWSCLIRNGIFLAAWGRLHACHLPLPAGKLQACHPAVACGEAACLPSCSCLRGGCMLAILLLPAGKLHACHPAVLPL